MAILTKPRRIASPLHQFAPSGASIDGGSPLAQNLVSWHLAQPWQFGGQTWYDLADLNHGTLTGLGTGGGVNGWNGTSRTGGRGAMAGNASTGRVTIPHSAAWEFGTESFAIAFSVRRRDGFGARQEIWIHGNNGGTPFVDAFFATGNSLNLQLRDSAGKRYYTTSSAAAIADSSWHRVVLERDMVAGSVRYFVDSIEYPATVSANDIGIGIDLTFNAIVTLGGLPNGGSGINALYDDIRIYRNRALSLDDVALDYRDSLSGGRFLLRAPRKVWVLGLGEQKYRSDPSRAVYKSNTPTVAHVAKPTPSKALYQARSPIVTIVREATPSRALHQTQQAHISRVCIAQPSRALTRSVASQVSKVVLSQASRALYHAQTPILTRIILATPSRGIYQSESGLLVNNRLGSAARSLYRTAAANAGLEVTTSPARALWRTTAGVVIQFPDPRTRIATPVYALLERQTPAVKVAL